MKIYVNARFLTQNVTGVQRYAIELSKQLKRLYGDKIKFVCPRNVTNIEACDELGAEAIGKHTGHVWEQLDLPIHLKKNGNPLLVNLSNTAPLLYANKVTTVHDITFVRFPDTYSKTFVYLYRMMIPLVIKSSKHIFTVSNFSKKEIITHYHCDQRKISVVYNAVSGEFQRIEDRELNKKKYFMAVSSVKGNKNFIYILEAFEQFSIVNKDVELFIIGDLKSSSFQTLNIDKYLQNPQIKTLGRVSDDDLIKYYSNALAFLFPSLYEGFGIPPLEAQACGCPAICADASCLPEIFGNSVLYCNPYVIDSMVNAMNKLAYDKELRIKMVNDGMKNVDSYSWQDSALEFADKIKTISGITYSEQNLIPKVNAKENYQLIVDDIFGKGNIVIDIDDKQNNLIGALCASCYRIFRQNFISRLKRLKDKYSTDQAALKCIYTQVKLIADNHNWEGAYGELAAYDILYNENIVGGIELDKTIAASESFSINYGMAATNEDVYFTESDIHCDVKIMADTIGKMLKGLIESVLKSKPFGNKCLVMPEFPLDDIEEDYQKNYANIKKELEENLKEGCGNIISACCPKLKFNVSWKGCCSSISSYDPYKRAKQMKYAILKRYSKKFTKNYPFMLVMVNFAWYNQIDRDSFGDNAVLYRSLARRVFCERSDANVTFTSIDPKFKGNETVFDVAKKMSAILFIDDFSVTKLDDNYTAYLYLNPNADNRIVSGLHYLETIVKNGSKDGDIENFEHDNY